MPLEDLAEQVAAGTLHVHIGKMVFKNIRLFFQKRNCKRRWI